ncbi:MAG: hypothetical protein LBT59_30485 [Clostridiales bacterium]|jgi:hypothetical protein|nr:hypothetical protein [Clostridiales bacterium]
MGQQFYLSLYDDASNEYGCCFYVLGKLGELAMNEHSFWENVKDRPLRMGFIGDEYVPLYNPKTEDSDDLCVASAPPRYQSDCAGEFGLGLPGESTWSGYVINHTKQVYFDAREYKDANQTGYLCLDPLVILTTYAKASSIFPHGFTEGTAYSLLGSWFTDVVEWSHKRPKAMDQLRDLEFRETDLKSALDTWGITPDGFLADRGNKTYCIRKNLGLFKTVIMAAKIRYKATREGNKIRLTSELVPDPGVTVKNEGGTVSLLNPDGSIYTDYRDEWLGNAYIIDRFGNRISCQDWLSKFPKRPSIYPESLNF